MGIAPRLRKPLPDSLGSRLLRFIAERTGPSDRQWVYVKLGEGELAPLGDVAPIKAFVPTRPQNNGFWREQGSYDREPAQFGGSRPEGGHRGFGGGSAE